MSSVVFPGRFQPFHNAHARILRRLLRDFDRVIVVIGSSDQQGKENPFSAKKRKAMIQAFFDSEKIPRKRVSFTYVPFAPDKTWVNVFLASVPRKTFNAVFTNNPRMKRQLKRFGIPFLSSRLFDRSRLSGKRIRKFPKDWKTRVPGKVAHFLTLQFQLGKRHSY